MGNKDAAISFLQLAASGRAREAFERHAAPGFRHHNPYFKGDAQTLMAGMDDHHREFPRKSCEVKQAIEEGDRVVLHAHVRFNPGDRGYALVHIFRFEGARIAELWDLGQEVPESSPNEHGMF